MSLIAVSEFVFEPLISGDPNEELWEVEIAGTKKIIMGELHTVFRIACGMWLQGNKQHFQHGNPTPQRVKFTISQRS